MSPWELQAFPPAPPTPGPPEDRPPKEDGAGVSRVLNMEALGAPEEKPPPTAGSKLNAAAKPFVMPQPRAQGPPPFPAQPPFQPPYRPLLGPPHHHHHHHHHHLDHRSPYPHPHPDYDPHHHHHHHHHHHSYPPHHPAPWYPPPPPFEPQPHFGYGFDLPPPFPDDGAPGGSFLPDDYALPPRPPPRPLPPPAPTAPPDGRPPPAPSAVLLRSDDALAPGGRVRLGAPRGKVGVGGDGGDAECGFVPFSPLSLERSQQCIDKSLAGEAPGFSSFDFGCDLLEEITTAMKDGDEQEERARRGAAVPGPPPDAGRAAAAAAPPPLLALGSYFEPAGPRGGARGAGGAERAGQGEGGERGGGEGRGDAPEGEAGVAEVAQQMEDLQATVKSHISEMDASLQSIAAMMRSLPRSDDRVVDYTRLQAASGALSSSAMKVHEVSQRMQEVVPSSNQTQ